MELHGTPSSSFETPLLDGLIEPEEYCEGKDPEENFNLDIVIVMRLFTYDVACSHLSTCCW